MFITGPDVVKTVTNEEVGKEELGGAQTHSGKSGVTHFMCDNEEETLMSIRELLSFLPSNNMEDAPLVPCNDDIHRQVEALQTVIPEDPNMPYDIKDIIEPVLDNQYFFEVMPHFAKNVVVGFGRLGGRSVGIVANQPAWLAGVLDIDASDKAARFIRFCDCFNIPLITFEDVPGFLPGTVQEHNGIIRHGAKIVYAYAEATVPKVTLITRKAYGGAYIVMSSKPTGADVNLAYPQAEIAVMGAEGAVNILYRKSAPEEKAEIIKEYEDKFSNPYRAAERGLRAGGETLGDGIGRVRRGQHVGGGVRRRGRFRDRHPERHARDGCQEPVALVVPPAGAGLGFENVLAHEARLSCSCGATERRASRCGVFSKPSQAPACGDVAGSSWASLAGGVPLLKWTWPKGPLVPVAGSRFA